MRTKNPLFHHALKRVSRRVLGLVATAAAAVAVVGGVGLIVAAPASAHTPTVTANCTTLSVNLSNYVASAGPTKVNTVAVTLDGATQNFTFNTTFAKTFSFADPTVNNHYEVAVTAWDAPSNPTYSPDITGTTSNCVPPVAKDASAATVVTAAGCAVPASAAPGAIENASWNSTSATSGPGSYSYTATAEAGHEFANGTTTQTFTGQLAGAVGYQGRSANEPCFESPASAVVVVTPATCTAPATAAPGETSNASWSSADTVSGPGDYGFVATASGDHSFASGASTLSFTGVLAGPLAAQSTSPEAPCYVAPAAPVPAVLPTTPAPTASAAPSPSPSAAPSAPSSAGAQLADTGSDVLAPLVLVGLLLAAGSMLLFRVGFSRRRKA